MGAQQFRQDGEGPTVREAFQAAREQALYEHGHGGYSGTLAEKQDYVGIDLPADVTPADAIKAFEQSYDEDSWPEWLTARLAELYDDKWGPAVAIRTGPSTWIFAGWASS